ncbi:MAG: DNA cytosine methyltransferase [Xanthomonadaceae bacterium]|nr:DNA cytosine methyltransferase [Xanthomonadaceae bacterium]
MFNTMHLFAGAGGGLLADLILGHTPIVAVEWDAYACAVLRERAAGGWFPGLHVHEGDVRMFDPSKYAGRVDCIHAGFPCQDISVAGSGAGIHGDRSGLYREVLRIADVVRPRFLFKEISDPRLVECVPLDGGITNAFHCLREMIRQEKARADAAEDERRRLAAECARLVELLRECRRWIPSSIMLEHVKEDVGISNTLLARVDAALAAERDARERSKNNAREAWKRAKDDDRG